MVRFGGHLELVSASVLASAVTSGTLFCSVATSFGLFSVSSFASSLVEVLIPDLVYHWLLPS
jgi:hypothetical protein